MTIDRAADKHKELLVKGLQLCLSITHKSLPHAALSSASHGALKASLCRALHPAPSDPPEPEIRPARGVWRSCCLFFFRKTLQSCRKNKAENLFHSSEEKFAPHLPAPPPPTPTLATLAPPPTPLQRILQTHRRPLRPPLLPSERSHACKWLPPPSPPPPPALLSPAGRLEGSLVDPPISPGPPASEKWSEAGGAESSMTSPEFPF